MSKIYEVEHLSHGERIITQKVTISKGKLSKEDLEKEIFQKAMETIQKLKKDDLEKYGFCKGEYTFKEAKLIKSDRQTYEYTLILGYRIYITELNPTQSLRNEER